MSIATATLEQLDEMRAENREGFERLERLIVGAVIAREGHPVEAAEEILDEND
jgi:hypothetical protein